jgi:hypothetical protein
MFNYIEKDKSAYSANNHGAIKDGLANSAACLIFIAYAIVWLTLVG